MKGIIELLHVFEHIMQADAIMYIEKNFALDGYYKIRYNSKDIEKFSNTIIEFPLMMFEKDILEKQNISV